MKKPVKKVTKLVKPTKPVVVVTKKQAKGPMEVVYHALNVKVLKGKLICVGMYTSFKEKAKEASPYTNQVLDTEEKRRKKIAKALKMPVIDKLPTYSLRLNKKLELEEVTEYGGHLGLISKHYKGKELKEFASKLGGIKVVKSEVTSRKSTKTKKV